MIVRKITIILLWIIICVGIYKCCTDTSFLKSNQDDKRIQEHNKENTVDNDKINENKEELNINDRIRVLLKTDDFNGMYHKELQLSSSEGLIVEINEKITEYKQDQICVLSNETFLGCNEVIVKSKNNGKINVLNITRNRQPQYRGELYCYLEEEGMVLVNELPVEEYLYGVVPSEMPSSYPLESLKAQAISARTYTYYHMKNYAYPRWKAHVDDSTSFQVYMNIPETAITSQAVEETSDLVLKYNDKLVESFYYSTSGGYNAGGDVWGSEQDMPYLLSMGNEMFAQNDTEGEASYKQYIDNGNQEDIEYYEPWYRWNYELKFDEENLKMFFNNLYQISLRDSDNIRIRSRFLQSKCILDEECIKDIKILDRKKSGLVTSILIKTPNFSVNVRTQHAIRQVLMVKGNTLVKKDGTEYVLSSILPSAFFYIDKLSSNEENGDNKSEGEYNHSFISGIIVKGGGMGHGAGMSQNGAKNLALRGFTALEILSYYYNTEVTNVADGG